jgi:F0F1-type ATP synthase membrane subunit b/b'
VAFRLTKQEDARKSELESELEQLVGETTDGLEELKEKITALVDDFNKEFVEPLSEKITEAYGFVEDIMNERQGEFDDKSERWQEGERGQAAQSWLQDWENGLQGLEAPSLLEAPDLYFDVPDANNALAELPFEADQ